MTYFFALAMAQADYRLAEENVASSDTLYSLSLIHILLAVSFTACSGEKKETTEKEGVETVLPSLPNEVTAVSYTHLDVYKRQIVCSPDCQEFLHMVCSPDWREFLFPVVFSEMTDCKGKCFMLITGILRIEKEEAG